VHVRRPARRAIEQTVVATGRVLAPAKVNLGTLVQGIVASVSAEEGQRVRAGDVLLTLHDDELQALAKQAKGSLGLASARLRQVSRVDAQLAREQQTRAEKELQKANLDYERMLELAKSGAVTPAQLSDAETALARAKEQRETAAIRVTSTAHSGIDTQSTMASVVNAQGIFDYANTRLTYGRIVAPADGVILTRSVEPGDVVTPGQVVLVLSRDGDTRLLVQPDERALSILALGQRAEASAEAFPRLNFEARVDWIAPLIDSNRGTVDVKLLVPKPPPYLRAEMTVQVTVHAARRDAALVVPPECVYSIESTHPYVLSVRQNRVERVDVEVGLRSSDAVEILAGLSDADWVVTTSTKPPAIGDYVRPKAN
jgi:HlyD family secretion protein